MAVYLTNIFLIYLFAFFLLLIKPSERKKAMYCVIVGLQWTLISGLRSVNVGRDTMQYRNRFNTTMITPWSTLFENLKQYALGRTNNVKDPGYPILEKTFQIFSTNYQVYLMLIAIFFTVALAIWIYKNSKMPCLSFIIYSCLFFTFFSITGHRQTIATVMVVFIGYHFIKKRKLIPFLLLIFIAFFIHKSSICFLPFYFFAYKEITKKYLAIFTAVTAVVVALGARVYWPIANAIGYDSTEGFRGDTSTFVIIIVAVGIISFVLFPIIKRNRPDAYKPLYNAMLFAMAFSLLTLREQAFMRVQQYYSLFLMLLLPEVILAFSKEWRMFPYIAGSSILIYKLIEKHISYSFFWQ